MIPDSYSFRLHSLIKTKGRLKNSHNGYKSSSSTQIQKQQQEIVIGKHKM